MLEHNDVVATIAVRDMEAAKKFYEDQLGLKLEATIDDGIRAYKAGDTRVFLYKSDRGGDSKTTVATWAVEDHIEDMVEELRTRGVTFEHFTMQGIKIEGDIHIAVDGMKLAWFKDPDGNILCLAQVSVH